MSEIGERLRRAREARGLSLSQAAAATHIRAKFLDALESGSGEVFASLVQMRGFLRNYAAFLELDAEDLLQRLDAELRVQVAAEPQEPADQPTPAALPTPRPAAFRPPAAAPRRSNAGRSLPAWITGDVLAGALIVGILLSGLT